MERAFQGSLESCVVTRSLCCLAMLKGSSQLAVSQSWWEGLLRELGFSRQKHRVDKLLLQACLLKLK